MNTRASGTRRAVLACSTLLTMATLMPLPSSAADSGAIVEPMKAGAPVKLYETPESKDSTVTAPPDSLPLRVEGSESNGFYPVNVRGKRYWVDGMEVKMKRTNHAQCNAGASVHAAGQLGAATNRCE
ncbi:MULTISPECIES: hypothetical protein [unclassified Caballeronia]|uniref:hypothetical protein n=1 Tax=unclassified Caballeronia TaxID=2646786 RepID=UPI00285DD2B8|nr:MULTISPECIES: hypothetical protein [unclassified Caballeronia]MDR5822170.1 hypothetical protein [Caballeronia sp. LZ043]MDR5880327.1 hypothetical protein [Caballeronia sp. LZ032]